MNNTEIQFKRLTRFFARLKFFLLFWALLGVAPTLIKVFGISFLPSPDWAHQVRFWSVGAGVFWMVVLPYVTLTGVMSKDQESGLLGGALAVIVAPLLGYWIGSASVTVGGPMLEAILFGSNTETLFTVKYLDGIDTRRCGNAITLEGLPFSHDELCGYPKELKLSFEKGQTILITGFGTPRGLFDKEVFLTSLSTAPLND